MSDNLERVLLTNVPDFLDGWVLKSTIPCGGLIHRVDINPLNSSKMMILTKGQVNAEKIANMLDNYNVCGSVIRARYIFVKPPEGEGSQATTDSTAVARAQGQIEKTSDEEACDGHFSTNDCLQRPPKAENEKLRQDRKGRTTATANSAETVKDARRDESAVRPYKTSSRGPTRSKDLQSQDSSPGNKQAKDSSSQSKESRTCRFCLQSGHATWSCKEKAEYYKVGWTTEGIKPPGCQWPESSIVKVEGLYAGPVIEYMEKNRLQMYRMNREQIRIMFAWLTNYMICHDCGAAGHRNSEDLCKYLPLDPPVTEKMIAQFRRPFNKRMKGLRDKMPFGKLQQKARRASEEFSDRMDILGGLIKYSGKRKGQQSEKLQRATSPDPTDKNGEQGSPEDLLIMSSREKRIKILDPDDFEQYTDDTADDDEEALI